MREGGKSGSVVGGRIPAPPAKRPGLSVSNASVPDRLVQPAYSVCWRVKDRRILWSIPDTATEMQLGHSLPPTSPTIANPTGWIYPPFYRSIINKPYSYKDRTLISALCRIAPRYIFPPLTSSHMVGAVKSDTDSVDATNYQLTTIKEHQ
ncbi:hypothetical protein BDV18DRAFT_52470 [Aspergillus unguis]